MYVPIATTVMQAVKNPAWYSQKPETFTKVASAVVINIIEP